MIKCLYLIFVTGLISLTACYTPRYVYSPTSLNVPVLKEKGDSKLAINYAGNFTGNQTLNSFVTENKSRGLDLHSAYALTRKWALQLNHATRKETNNGDFENFNLDSSVIRYKRTLTEFGVGYFTSLDSSKKLCLQIFAGMGLGKSAFTDRGRDQSNVYHDNFHSMRVTKYFLQPALIVSLGSSITSTFASRFSFLSFHNIQTNYNSVELDRYKLDSLSYSPRVFWEPALINSFGFKKFPGVLLEVQAGMAFLVSRRFVDYRSFNFAAGLYLDLRKLLKMNSGQAKNG